MAKQKASVDPLEVAALRDLALFLLQNLKDAIARAEALRFLLETHRVFSHDEYERALAEAQQAFDRSMTTMLQEKDTVARTAAIQRLFEKPPGKPQ